MSDDRDESDDEQVVASLGEREMLDGGTLPEDSSEPDDEDSGLELASPSSSVDETSDSDPTADSQPGGEGSQSDGVAEARQSLVDDEDEELELDLDRGSEFRESESPGGADRDAGADEPEPAAGGGDSDVPGIREPGDPEQVQSQGAPPGSPKQSSGSGWGKKLGLLVVVIGIPAGLASYALTLDWGIGETVTEKIGLVDEVEEEVEQSARNRKESLERRIESGEAPAESEETGETSFADKAAELVGSGSSGRKYTTTGIFEAVAAARWEPSGEESFVEVDGQRRVIRDYRWEQGKMRVQIRTFESADGAEKAVESVSDPNIGMQIGPHLVTLIPRGDTDPIRLKDAQNMLERYHRMMEKK